MTTYDILARRGVDHGNCNVEPAIHARRPFGFAGCGAIRIGGWKSGEAAPDLAVEVVSPNDTAEEVDAKVMEWLNAGVPLVWVVSPGVRKVRVQRPRNAALGPISMLGEEDAISGEDVLPGFSCRVSEFFENT